MRKNILEHKKNKGFTLLELLVVMSIIGLLVAIGVASFSTVQKKGRDARRKADIKAIQDGFEQYYAENDNQYANSCATMLNDTDFFPGGAPEDPQGTAYSSNCSASSTSYCVCADVETAVGNKDSANCSGAAGDDWFCLSNLQ